MVLVAGVGCAFDHGQAAEGDDGPAADAGDPVGSDGGSGIAQRSCRYPDSSLKLCLEFDDGVLTPIVRDGSGGQRDPSATGLMATMRDTDHAVKVESGASITLAENAALDVDKITIEAWVNPDVLQSASILRNEGQYVLLLDGSGRVGCQMAGVTVLSDQYAPHAYPGYWSHVACTFDGTYVKAFINGGSMDCAKGSELTKSGTMGTTIAPNFRGGIDGVRVYSD